MAQTVLQEMMGTFTTIVSMVLTRFVQSNNQCEAFKWYVLISCYSLCLSLMLFLVLVNDLCVHVKLMYQLYCILKDRVEPPRFLLLLGKRSWMDVLKLNMRPGKIWAVPYWMDCCLWPAIWWSGETWVHCVDELHTSYWWSTEDSTLWCHKVTCNEDGWGNNWRSLQNVLGMILHFQCYDFLSLFHFSHYCSIRTFLFSLNFHLHSLTVHTQPHPQSCCLHIASCTALCTAIFLSI